MKLYILDITNETELKSTPERYLRKNRYLKQKDRLRCLGAGILMKEYLGVDSEEQLCYNKYGKPKLASEKCCFNISHAGDYVVMVTSKHEVGVDIEKIVPYSKKVAQKCFTKEELDWLFLQQEESSFYKLWTAKESIMKATGLGFNLEPSSFCVLPVLQGEHIINDEAWCLKWIEIKGHICCVASAKKNEKCEVINVNF